MFTVRPVLWYRAENLPEGAMDIDRLKSLMDLKTHYDRLGLRDPADYEAAGFSQSELADSGLFKPTSTSRFGVMGDGSTVQAYEPSDRDAAAYWMADKISDPESYLGQLTGLSSRGAYEYARQIMGTDDPSAPLYNAMGLVDLTPAAAYYDTSEGLDTVGEGISQGDLGTVGIGALQTALGVASAIPVAKGAVKAADKVVDPMFRRQAEQFAERTAPVFPVDTAAGYRPYLPSVDELAKLDSKRMRAPEQLTDAERDYLARRADADALAANGASPQDILDQTGVMNMPVVDATGYIIGTRPYAMLTEDELLAMRPNAREGWTTRSENLDPWWSKYLPGLQHWRDFGYADPAKKEVVLSSSPEISPDMLEQTRVHEFTHVDLGDSKILGAEQGASPSDFSQVLPAPYDPKTRVEMYSYNPGEQLARLSSNEPTDVVRLTPLETLNPYINSGKGPVRRAKDALTTSMFSDTYTLPFSFRPPTGAEGKLQLPITATPSRLPDWLVRDSYARVPMDLSKAQMYHFAVNPRMPMSLQMSASDIEDYFNIGRKLSP